MRLVIVLLAIVGGIILVGMTIAPTQPTVRDWYITQACPYLDMASTDICAPVRRAAEGKTL